MGAKSWKETVLSQIEIDIIDGEGVIEGDIVPYLNRQAEITGGIVFKAGIKEVVEWIKENRETPLGKDQYGYYIWETKLEAKLKEWGIE